MSMRTPLARVRGHGSAKSGAHHWLAQRMTALALIPLFLWLVASVVALVGSDYADAIAWLRSPWNSGLLILLMAAMFYHAQLGMQVVFEDYIAAKCMRATAIILVKFLAALLAVVSIIAVVRVAWGS